MSETEEEIIEEPQDEEEEVLGGAAQEDVVPIPVGAPKPSPHLERMPQVGNLVGYRLGTLPPKTAVARVTACREDGSLDLAVLMENGTWRPVRNVGPGHWEAR